MKANTDRKFSTLQMLVELASMASAILTDATVPVTEREPYGVVLNRITNLVKFGNSMAPLSDDEYEAVVRLCQSNSDLDAAAKLVAEAANIITAS